MGSKAIYARVSGDEQERKETIEMQINAAKKYVDLHELEIHDWYVDDGVSGRKLRLEDRPDGARLMQDARAGHFDALHRLALRLLGVGGVHAEGHSAQADHADRPGQDFFHHGVHTPWGKTAPGFRAGAPQGAAEAANENH